MSIFRSDIEFKTDLEMSLCRTRLESAGASVWIGKTFITRRDTDRLGFLWYEKHGLKAILFEGPALLGEVTPAGDYRLVQASFRPYLAWKWFLLGSLVALIYFIAQGFFAQRDIQISQYIWGGMFVLVVSLIQLGFYLTMKNGWKRLSARLREVLSEQILRRTGKVSIP